MISPTVSLIIPTIEWTGSFDICAQQAQKVLKNQRIEANTTNLPRDECLIVFDGTPSPPPPWLRQDGVNLIATGVRAGPAVARNLAAHHANSEILLFLDADVELHPDAIERVRAHFAAAPDLDAVFGSYDDSPAAPGLVSQFRNLLHHYTHSSHPGPACTFWAGCGAVRRSRFLELGGFDPRYSRPSIEDIDFGMRLAAARGKILLDPAIQCTHHKRWTLTTMVLTDIRQRAIPWSRLLIRRRHLPATLNLNRTARLSGLVSVLLATSLLALPLCPPAGYVALTALALLLIANRPFYGFCRRKRGARFMLAAVALHSLYLLYSTLTFGVIALQSLLYPKSLEPNASL